MANDFPSSDGVAPAGSSASGGASGQMANGQIQPRLVAVKSSIEEIVHGNYFEVAGRWEPDYLITPAGRRMSRVNLLGIVVANFFAEDGNYGTVTLDDGTETIRLKSFKGEVKSLRDLQMGQVVSVIGKLRKYKDEVYIAPEAIFQSDLDRLTLRKLELLKERRKIESLKSLVVKTSAEFDEPGKLVDFLSTKYGFDRSVVEAVIIAQNPPSSQQQSQGSYSNEQAVDPQQELQAAPSPTAQKAKQGVLSAIEKTGSTGAEYGAILRETGISSAEVDEAIKELISEGEIFEPKSGRFRRLL
jgi:RPA family protein